MRTIASTLLPDSIPEHVVLGGMDYTKSALIGAEVFSIQSVWLPFPEKMNDKDRAAFALKLDAIASECLPGNFVKQSLPSEEIAHTYLVPTRYEIEAAIRKYCEIETIWRPRDDMVAELAPIYQSLGLRFAKTVVEAPNIVIQQSPPTLIEGWPGFMIST